ncbi:MAG: hypothetical protein A2X12_01045 [Bacteroidetes bacterium GWE2_29_8]|nr:MAG: hypothetical protein A2X12_01045 [Bacteroidetes bacterium GWE2_29_8]OFY14400.1 MAG: hypothetical protein A2X02_01180 [Bacteroidetes bacterium GWF2_29_10]
MKVKKIFLLINIIVIVVVLLNGCNNSVNEKETSQDNVSISNTKQNKSNKNIFRVPLPMDLYVFLNENKVAYKAGLLNSYNKVGEYYSTIEKSINLGIYSSDLAYSSVYKDNQNINKYFVVCKKLADGLELSEGFDKSTLIRIDKNINNPDSLFEIANDAYWNVFLSLEEQGKSEIVSCVVYGAWLESIYISINSINKFDINNEVTQRIMEQQLVLENIMNYVNEGNSENTKTKSIIINELKDIGEIYIKIINDGELASENDFNKLKQTINEIRNKWIK